MRSRYVARMTAGLRAAGLVLAMTMPVTAQPAPVDTAGKPVLRAVQVPGGIKLDGQLDEEVYQANLPTATAFIQSEPYPGQPGTEKTEAWVFFDDKNLYFCFRLWDSHPERMIINEMRHDASQDIFQNENISIIIDTFHDQRSGYYFMTNPLGARRDVQFQSEQQNNSEWNPVWNPKAQRFDGGWTAEVAIPFKSIRYPAGVEQTWGVNLRRVVRWKNETTFLTAIPPGVAGGGVFRLQDEATLVGLKVPAAGRNLDILPFVTGRSTTDRVARPVVNNQVRADWGGDLKMGVTKGLTADFTYNTDFAQVEDDLQQVNLTRFGVFFPEKRAFFLEGQGIFSFGGDSGGDIPTMFFSRQVGLARGTPVPIVGGGRLTGKAGAYTIGVVDIQTEQTPAIGEPSTNFGVLRLRRDILKKSYVGVMATRRTPSVGRDNLTVGVDTNIGLGLHAINAYLAKTSTPGRSGEDFSYMAAYDFPGDRYGASGQRLVVGKNFNPEMGFLRRQDFQTTAASFRFSPRPRRGNARLKAFRKFSYSTAADYTTDNEGRLQSRSVSGSFNADLMNGGGFSGGVDREFEGLTAQFQIAPGVRIPVGGYGFTRYRAGVSLPPSFRVRGNISANLGDFYDGTRQTLTYTGRVEVTKQFTIEPTLSLNRVRLPAGAFTTNLVQSRISYTFTPRTTLGTLVQYNSSARAVSANVRFRWEYIPGSDLFVVYTEGRTTAVPDRFADLQNRTFVVKLTRLLRY
ncbi:MAG: DUF5916 domain-containing protein [Vicinamibacterales bacterium]